MIIIIIKVVLVIIEKFIHITWASQQLTVGGNTNPMETFSNNQVFVMVVLLSTSLHYKIVQFTVTDTNTSAKYLIKKPGNGRDRKIQFHKQTELGNFYIALAINYKK